MGLEQEIKKDVGDHSTIPLAVSLPCRKAIYISQNHRPIQGFLQESAGLGIMFILDIQAKPRLYSLQQKATSSH